MARKKKAVDLLDILKRLRRCHSIKQIRRDTGSHRSVIRKIKQLALEHLWLADGIPLPSLHELQALYYNHEVETTHPLHAHRDLIRSYLEDETPVSAIRRDLVEDYGFDGSESQLRRYIRKHFDKRPSAVVPRKKEKGIMEVDFTNVGIVYDPQSNRNRKAYIFSARLRFSRHAYRELVFSQRQEVFWRCHIHAFEYFGGVPLEVVPDNLKAAVIKASFYDPILNRGYFELGTHYDFLISPTKPRKPEHKGGIENDMQYVTGNFLKAFKVRQRRKGRLVPHADDLREEMNTWNENVAMPRIIRETGRTVADMFSEERDFLKPLPLERWDIVAWATVKVRITSRVYFDKCTYTVPDRYIGEKVVIAANLTSIRVYRDCELIAVHQRAEKPYQDVVRSDHLTERERAYREHDHQFLVGKAAAVGPHAEAVAQLLLAKKHVNCSGAVRGLLSLAKKYSPARLERACMRALHYDEPTYRAIKRILFSKLDELALTEPTTSTGQQHFKYARDPQVYNFN